MLRRQKDVNLIEKANIYMKKDVPPNLIAIFKNLLYAYIFTYLYM